MSNRSRGNGGDGEGDHRSTPPNIDTMHSLKVDNLTYRTRVEDLRKKFEKFGPIGDIYIPRDQFSRSSRGYAFIRFVDFSSFDIGRFVVLIDSRENAMPKTRSTGWTAPISMEEKFEFNSLGTVEPRQRTAVIARPDINGKTSLLICSPSCRLSVCCASVFPLSTSIESNGIFHFYLYVHTGHLLLVQPEIRSSLL